MEIRDWTSAGINWEKPQLASTFDAIESIRLALIERMSAIDLANHSMYGWMAKDASEEIKFKSVFDTVQFFHQCITFLMPLFVNHTDSGGDWNGKTDIPAWSEKNMLEAIGAEKRIPITRLNPLSEWIIQTYKILNNLKWVCNCVSKGTRIPILNDLYQKNSAKSSWSECKNDFYNSNWTVYGGGSANYHAASIGDDWYEISVARSKIRIPLSVDFKCTREFWLNAYSLGNQTIRGVSFSDSNYKYVLFKTENEGDGPENGEYYIFSDEDFAASELIDPDENALNAVIVAVNTPASVVITKYDGPNGFKFIEK